MKKTIFTGAEEKALKERLLGYKNDATGIYAARVKPKIFEMLNRWFPKARKLKKIVSPPDAKG